MSKPKRNGALLQAVLMDDLAAVEEQIKLGAEIDARDPEHEQTGLMLASIFGRYAMAKLLIELGASVKARDDSGRTAVSLALYVEKGSQTLSPLFKLLIDHGADINSRDGDGTSVLIWKVLSGASLEVVEELLSLGADPRLEDDQGQTALSVAESYGFTNIANFLRSAMKSQPSIKIGEI